MADRVTIKSIRVDDVIEREAQEQYGREIINGVWSEENEMAGKENGRIGTRIVAALFAFVDAHQLGEVYAANTNYVLQGSKGNIITMRIPNVSFVAAERVDHDDPGYYYLAPDLAVEIVSPSEKYKITAEKVADYLQFGSKQVWVVYPEQQSVSVHLADGSVQTYEREATISGGDVLPGFTIKVAQILGKGYNELGN